MKSILYVAVAVLAVCVLGAGGARAQTKIEKGAVILTNAKCLSMCRERGFAGSEERCKRLCRPGCRNAATGERFCVK